MAADGLASGHPRAPKAPWRAALTAGGVWIAAFVDCAAAILFACPGSRQQPRSPGGAFQHCTCCPDRRIACARLAPKPLRCAGPSHLRRPRGHSVGGMPASNER